MSDLVVHVAQAQVCTKFLEAHGHIVAVREVRAFASLKAGDMQTHDEVRLARPDDSLAFEVTASCQLTCCQQISGRGEAFRLL